MSSVRLQFDRLSPSSQGGTATRYRIPRSTHSSDPVVRDYENLLDRALADWKADGLRWLQERAFLHNDMADLQYRYDRLMQELEAWKLSALNQAKEVSQLKANGLTDKERNAFHDVIGALTKERDGWRSEALRRRKEHEEFLKVDRARDTIIRDQANFREEPAIAMAEVSEVKRLVLVALTSAPANMSEHERQTRKRVFDELWPQVAVGKL